MAFHVQIVSEDEVSHIGRVPKDLYMPVYEAIIKAGRHEAIKIEHSVETELAGLARAIQGYFRKKRAAQLGFFCRVRNTRRNGKFILYVQKIPLSATIED